MSHPKYFVVALGFLDNLTWEIVLFLFIYFHLKSVIQGVGSNITFALVLLLMCYITVEYPQPKHVPHIYAISFIKLAYFGTADWLLMRYAVLHVAVLWPMRSSSVAIGSSFHIHTHSVERSPASVPRPSPLTDVVGIVETLLETVHILAAVIP